MDNVLMTDKLKNEKSNRSTKELEKNLLEHQRAEQSLHKSEEDYRLLVNNVPGIVYRGYKDWSVNFFDNKIESLTQHSPYEFNSKKLKWIDIVLKEDIKSLKESFARALITDKSFVREYRIKTKDGNIKWIQERGQIVCDSNNDTKHITGVFFDITQQKQSEEALRKSEKKYRTLLETTREGYWRIDSEGKIIEVNHALFRMLGYRQDELIGRPPCDFIDDENQKDFIEETSTILSSGHRSYEITLKKKNGQDLHTYFNTTTIRDESGKIQGSFAFITDITKRKQAEEERNRLAVAIEQAAESALITDQNGIIQYVNPSFERLSGYSPKEVIGQHLSTLRSGKHDASFYEKIWHTLTRGSAWHGRIINRKKDGSFYEADATISPVSDKSGKITNFVSIKRDITHEIELENRLIQSQKMESIGTLAGGIAHDFNNILSSVIGYTELAIDNTEKGTLLHDNLQEVLSAAKRACDLVKQILIFSRQADQELKPLNVQLVVKEALKLTRSVLPTTIEIQQNISDTCGPVMADATQIHQVVMNLLTNAFHAMEDDGGTLKITLKQIDLAVDDLKDPAMVPGPYICLTVADTGIGIDKSVIDRIFEPYFTTKNKDKGTGLGLATVHGIVKSYGGDIKVCSKPSQGTEFQVYLPAIRTRAEIKEITGGISPLERGTERILFVDDEAQIVRVAQQMLESLGYHVTARTSSIETLEAFRAAPHWFDLVITDMTMPNMTGVELAKKLLEIRPDIPIIICTGFSEKISEHKAKAMGIRGYAMKPVVRTELAGKIRHALDQS
jgi:PAS domain S-box-containing protein